MNPGVLRHSVVVEHKGPVSPSKNVIGEDDYSWETFHPTRARIRSSKGKEQVTAEAQESLVDTEVYMRYFPGIVAGMRVKYTKGTETIYYDIRSVDNVGELNRELYLYCTRGNSLG